MGIRMGIVCLLFYRIYGIATMTEAGNKYILISTDYFFKWVEAYPMANQESQTVAELLVYKFISHCGVPSLIHTNQRQNFESALFTEVCELLNITKTRTTPYEWRQFMASPEIN